MTQQKTSKELLTKRINAANERMFRAQLRYEERVYNLVYEAIKQNGVEKQDDYEIQAPDGTIFTKTIYSVHNTDMKVAYFENTFTTAQEPVGGLHLNALEEYLDIDEFIQIYSENGAEPIGAKPLFEFTETMKVVHLKRALEH